MKNRNKVVDLTGEKLGRLTVIGLDAKTVLTRYSRNGFISIDDLFNKG